MFRLLRSSFEIIGSRSPVSPVARSTGSPPGATGVAGRSGGSPSRSLPAIGEDKITPRQPLSEWPAASVDGEGVAAMDDATRRRVDRLFSRLLGIYGQKWASSVPTEAAEDLVAHEWAPVVEAMTDDQIRAAIEACKSSGDQWPPTFATFVRRGLGLPAKETAAWRALRGDRDTLSRLMRQQMGGVSTLPADQSQKLAAVVYEQIASALVQTVLSSEPVDPRRLLGECLDRAQLPSAPAGSRGQQQLEVPGG